MAEQGNEDGDKTKEIQSAQEIYNYLREHKDNCMLTSFGKGEVILSDGRSLSIALRVQGFNEEDTRNMLEPRGFTRDEIDKGIQVINEIVPEGRSYKNVFIGESSLKAKKLVIDEEFADCDMSDKELDAIRTIAMLSAIPARIYDKYGDFGKFQEELENPDFDGLNVVTLKTGKMLYDGGLKNYVEAIGRMRDGAWDQGTSDRRTISMSSKDQSQFYESLVSKIDKFIADRHRHI